MGNTEKKKAIFESTLRLVVENGFHGCPMSQVAKSAEVAAGTIYHHFENKEQLIRELYNYIMERVLEAMSAGDSTEMSFKERFFNLWKNLYNFYIQNPDVLKFYPQFIHSPYNTNRYEQGHDQFHEKIFAFFQEGIEQGSLRQVKPEILGVLAHSNVMTSARIHGYGKIKLTEPELDLIAEMFWDGISAGK